MTSSQPVTTPNALNFTPDNLRAYAYSGDVTVSQTGTTSMLLFNTNSEYIVGSFQISTSNGNGVNSDMEILLNDIATVKEEFGNTYQLYPGSSFPWQIIIPPFTKCELTMSSQSGDLNFQAQFTGEAYGMTKTEYQ